MMPPRSASGRSFTPAVRERPGDRAAAAAKATAGNASAASCWAWALPAPDMAAAGGGGGSSGRLSGGQVCPSRLGGPRTLLQVTVTMSEAGTTQAWSAELRHLACACHAGCCVAAARNAFAAPDGRLSLSYQHVIRLENFNTCVSGEHRHTQPKNKTARLDHARLQTQCSYSCLLQALGACRQPPACKPLPLQQGHAPIIQAGPQPQLCLGFKPHSALPRVRCCRRPPWRRPQPKVAGWRWGTAAPPGLARAPLQSRGWVGWR